MIKHEFKDNNRFYNIHYLQNLVFIYENNLKNIHFQSNNSGFLVSKDAIVELKLKIDRILDEYYKKVNNLNIEMNANNSKKPNLKQVEPTPLVKFLNLNFSRSEIFTKTTSFSMLNLTTKLISSVILLLSKKIEQAESKYSNLAESSPTKYESNQHYIIYFFEILTNLDDSLRKLTENQYYKNFYVSNLSLKKDLEEFKDNLSNRIGKIILKNLKESFLVKYGESTKSKLATFLI
jgi:tRNA/tmRNA/rRNA uracil-C5-methylase (TrmA/RlmC/RlmD family)